MKDKHVNRYTKKKNIVRIMKKLRVEAFRIMCLCTFFVLTCCLIGCSHRSFINSPNNPKPTTISENYGNVEAAGQSSYSMQNVTETSKPMPTLTSTPVTTQASGIEIEVQFTPTPTPTPTPSPTPTPTEVPQLTIAMAGDILIHASIEADCKQDDGSYDYHSIFSLTKDYISSFDVSIVNQELIIGGEELGISGYPSFNTAYSLADALADAGFDIACHATNHALDKGKKGILNCIRNWKENHPEVGVVGIYETEEESEQIYVVEKNDIKVAVLNFTYGTNGIKAPGDMPWCVNMLTKENVVKALDEAEQIADFTIVCPHWGTEYSLEPSSAQKEYMAIFKEHGADLVIGTHPHVIQGITVVNDEGEFDCMDAGYALSPDDMLVYYSIGNFVSWTSEYGTGIANRMLGGISDVTIRKNEDGKVYISDFGITPVVSHVENGHNAVCVYPFADYTGELAEKSAINSQDKTYSLQYLDGLCNQIWGNLWKKNGTPSWEGTTAFQTKITLTHSADKETKKLTDESYKTVVAFEKDETLTVSSDLPMHGLYIKWNNNPKPWTLEAGDVQIECGQNGFLHEYVVIPEGASECVMHFSAYESICEISAYSAGTVPGNVQRWEPSLKNADILVFSTHADDEILFLGGVLATYGGEFQKKIQLVYMCEFFTTSSIREHEKLDGVWLTGVRNYPVSGDFRDEYCETLDGAKRIYDFDKLKAFITENIRRFKPQVVVTQDENGEYGHGAHLILVDAVKAVIDNTKDATYYPQSAEIFGVWDTPKTYLHIYKENGINMDLRHPVEAFGGKTALEILKEAYKLHVSQQWCWYYVADDYNDEGRPYKYSCSRFGLYRTTVGPDTGNDMLENVKTYGE